MACLLNLYNAEIFLYNVQDEITYPLLNLNGATVEVKELISNSKQHFTGYVIIYPCWD